MHEYDNFANEVLMTGRQQADYEALLYGEGVLKTLFKAVKSSTREIDRVFITGVSPVVLGDMTSGYNVGKDIYLKAAFNDLLFCFRRNRNFPCLVIVVIRP